MTRARDLSLAKIDRAMDYLESTKKGVLDATKGLSDVLAVQTRGVKADGPYLPKE
jgi:hypothetical protein